MHHLPPRVRHKVLSGLVLSAMLLSSGCFSYVRVDQNGPVTTGAEVRAMLSEPGSVELMAVTVNDVTRVDGEVVTWNPETLVLSAFWLRANNGSEHRGVGETVYIPRGNLLALERKSVSVGRTALLAGFVALVGVLGNAAMSAGGASEGDGGPPPVTR